MISDKLKREYYQALEDRNTEYEGIFFVGVKSTGVFSRPTCSARTPKFENCEFFETAEQARAASFKPCRRCNPLDPPEQVPEIVRVLVAIVEKNPEKRWKNKDFQKLSVDASTVRRQFKKRFNMTFAAYVRAKRVEVAIKKIKTGHPVIEAQISSGYESGSGFRYAFARIMGAPPSRMRSNKILKASRLDLLLGPMLAIADDQSLYLLEFMDFDGLEKKIENLKEKTKAAIIPGQNQTIYLIEKELKMYFKGNLKTFKTPLVLLGSPFQRRVWEELKKIPPGETRSYSDLALIIGKPAAFRAIALANKANQLAIVVPCHRVVYADGSLGEYEKGIARKKWLLNHEKEIQ